MSILGELVKPVVGLAKDTTKAVQRVAGTGTEALGGKELTSFLTKQFQGGARSLKSIFGGLGGVTNFAKGSKYDILSEIQDTLTDTTTGIAGGEGPEDDTELTKEEKANIAGRAQRLRLFKATGRQSLIRTSGQGVRDRATTTTRARAT